MRTGYRELRERIADRTSTYDADALPLSYLGTAAQPVRIHAVATAAAYGPRRIELTITC